MITIYIILMACLLHQNFIVKTTMNLTEKGRDLTQSYDKSPTENEHGNTKTPPKLR